MKILNVLNILNSKIARLIFIIICAVPATLQASITGPGTVCEGISGIYTYTTSPPPTTATWSVTTGTAGVDYILTANGTTANILWIHAGTYHVIAQTETLTVIVNASPIPDITASSNVGCLIYKEGAGSPLSLSHDIRCDRVCENSSVVYQTPLHTGSTYHWEEIGAISSSLSGSDAICTVHWGVASGIASVRVTETLGGCSATATICVDGVSTPHAVISSLPAPTGSTIYTCAGVPVQFSDMSTIVSSLSQPNYITNRYWDFGDGSTSSVQNPSHSYASGGAYTVTLHVTNQCGCEDVATVTVSVGSTGPEIECPTTKCHDDTANYYTSAVCSTYNWSVTNGTFVPMPSPTDNSVHVVWGNGNSGPGQVTLSTPSCGGACPTPTVAIVPLLPANPVISGPTQVCAGQTYTYSVPMVPSTTYTWTVVSGSATIFTQDYQTQVIIHSSCTLSVTMTNTFYHCSSTATLALTMKNPFVISSTDGNILCQNSTHTFSSGGTGTGYSTLQWHLEDESGSIVPGTSFTGATYAPTFSSPGMFSVVAEDGTGFFCTSRVSQTVQINDVPTALTGIGPVSCICPGQLYTYSASASTSSSYLRWTATGATGGTQQQVGNSITVSWSGTGMSLDVVEVAANGCASAAYTTPISKCTLPASITFSGPGLDHPCENSQQTYIASVTDADSYHWSITPPDAGSIIGTPTNTVTVQWHNMPSGTTPPYTLTLVATRCGSTQTYTKSITVVSAPIPTIMAGNLCNGTPLTFSTPASGTYQWSTNGSTPASGPNTYSTSAGASTTIAIGLTVAYACGASASNTTVFAVAQSPQVNIDPAVAHICPAGSSLTLTAVVANATSPTYHWSTTATTSSISVSTVGTYTVSVTSGTCTTTASRTTDNNCSTGGGCTTWTGTPTTPAFTSSISNCYIASFTASSLAASPTPTVTWDFGESTSSSNTATGTTPSHTYGRAGIFTVTMTVTYPGYCNITVQHNVTINNSVAFKYGVTCSGINDIVTFTSFSTAISGTPSYQWSTSPSVAPTGTGNTYSVTPTVSSTTNVTLKENTTGCTATQSVALPYITAPSITVANSNCSDNPITLSVSPVPSNIASIQWGWSALFGTGPSVSFATTASKTVTMTAIDIYGCSHTAMPSPSMFQQVDNHLSLSLPTPSRSCLGSTVTLTGTPSATGFTLYTPLTYQWSDGSHFTPNNTDQVTVDGNYTVTATDTKGCKQTAVAGVSFLTVPAPNLSGPQEACQGDKLTYTTIDYGASSGFTYKWSVNGTVMTTGTTATYTIASASSTTTVSLQLLYSGCSSAPISLVTTVHPSPATPIAAISGNKCLSVAPVSLAVSSPVPGVTYHWSNGQSGNPISVTGDGLYDVYAVDNTYGCASSLSGTVTVLPAIDLTRLIQKCLFTCLTNNPVVTMPNIAANTYTWHSGSITGPVVGTGYQFTPTLSGTYYLHVQNTDNCQGDSGPFDIQFGDCGNCCKNGLFAITSMSCTSTSPCTWSFSLSYINPNMISGDKVIVTADGGTLVGGTMTVTATGTTVTLSGQVTGNTNTKEICFDLVYSPKNGGKSCTQQVCSYVTCSTKP